MENQTGNSLTKEQLANIIRMGLIMSNKTDGPFRWEIDYIQLEKLISDISQIPSLLG
ncbi:MAG: hypothetical protein ACI86M_000105 [Saprospiraceae bacterium]|jgi:hypothetical protein